MSDFSLRAVSRNSRCGISLEARWPPCPTGAPEPSRSTRSSHLMATDSLSSERRAAARRLIAPFLTASIPRSRKSCEYGFGIPAGLRPANRLNQNVPDSGIPALDSSQRQPALAPDQKGDLSTVSLVHISGLP